MVFFNIETKIMNIVIVGQGAIGLLWYAHLQSLRSPTINLSLLTSRSNKNQQARQHCYFYTHFLGLSEQRTYQVASPQKIKQADTIIVCVKSYQVAEVIDYISPLLQPKATLVLAHNGMGTLEEISPLLNAQQSILTLLTTHGCTRAMPFHIIHTGLGDTHLGAVQGRQDVIFQQQLVQLLNQAMPCVSWQNNIIEKQWLKLAVNCVINPLTALNNVNNGDITKICYQAKITKIIAEIVAVAQAEGQYLNTTELQQQVLNVAEKTAKNCSSMRADVLAKRETEIHYINGYIHRLGVKHHINTRENTQLWQAIMATHPDKSVS